MSAGAQLPLAMVHEGEKVRVVRVSGNDEMRRHLENLGFVEGAEVHVITQTGASGSIVKVKGSQLGVDHATAMHVYTTTED
ncbi:FeoA family protein [uncultured Parolsenella sp.]|uniref:FeoA family protein n=1 Tax=uncultured Parolsenella sp. TaxID=2083008 RepID=UPI0025F37D2B|nr:FeoA family protein [uncultured Parolsenella sp.]